MTMVDHRLLYPGCAGRSENGSPSLLEILAGKQDRLSSFLRDFGAAHNGSEPFFTKSAGEPVFSAR